MRQKKPKLLYAITKASWGGAQKYVFDLATHPDIRKRFDVEILSGIGPDGNIELISKLEKENIKVHILKNIKRNINPLRDVFAFYELYKNIKSIAPDIIHVNSSKMGLLGSVIARHLKIKTIVFTAHGWAFNENRSFFSKIFFRILSQITVLMSHRTIAVSNNIITSLKPISKIKNKIQVIYNGIKDQNIKPLPKLSSGSGVQHVVSIGELHPSKNHLSVIRMMKHIKNIHYHIIGDGELKKKIEQEIKKRNLENRVTMHGHVKMANQILPQFDIFLLPSNTEALGYVVLEALQAGLPVIARRVGGVPEIIENLPHARLYTHDNELISLLPNFNPDIKEWNDYRFKFENMINETKNLYITLLAS
jgi:glycosyltransferase involved in cell wall biosynthesis